MQGTPKDAPRFITPVFMVPSTEPAGGCFDLILLGGVEASSNQLSRRDHHPRRWHDHGGEEKGATTSASNGISRSIEQGMQGQLRRRGHGFPRSGAARQRLNCSRLSSVGMPRGITHAAISNPKKDSEPSESGRQRSPCNIRSLLVGLTQTRIGLRTGAAPINPPAPRRLQLLKLSTSRPRLTRACSRGEPVFRVFSASSAEAVLRRRRCSMTEGYRKQ